MSVVNLNATNEVFITDNAPANNYVGSNYLVVGPMLYNTSSPLYSPKGNNRSCFIFDLTSIPDGSTINAVTLYTYVWMAGNAYQSTTFRIRQILGTAWTESGLTWNNCPSWASTDLATLVDNSWTMPLGWLSLTGNSSMKSAIAAALSGNLISLGLFCDWNEDHNGWMIDSKRYNTAYRPYLQVDYTAPASWQNCSVGALGRARDNRTMSPGNRTDLWLSGTKPITLDDYKLTGMSLSGTIAPYSSVTHVLTLTGGSRVAELQGSSSRPANVVWTASGGTILGSSRTSAYVSWGPIPISLKAHWDDLFNGVQELIRTYP